MLKASWALKNIILSILPPFSSVLQGTIKYKPSWLRNGKKVKIRRNTPGSASIHGHSLFRIRRSEEVRRGGRFDQGPLRRHREGGGWRLLGYQLLLLCPEGRCVFSFSCGSSCIGLSLTELFTATPDKIKLKHENLTIYYNSK